jgi:hypothetical protein
MLQQYLIKKKKLFVDIVCNLVPKINMQMGSEPLVPKVDMQMGSEPLVPKINMQMDLESLVLKNKYANGLRTK